MSRLSLLLTLLLLGAICIAYPQIPCTIVVKDSATTEPIPGVNVLVSGTAIGGSTDAGGKVVLKGVPEGSQTLQISAVGYTTQSVAVEVMKGMKPVEVLLVAEAAKVDEVLITTNRLNSRVEDTPVKVEVLGTEEMNEENSVKPGNVASILGDISGVQIQQTSAVSGNSVVRMQGLDGKYTLLMVDGIPSLSGLSGGLNILQIPPLDLRQIEIIKGPASTISGGSAIAGLINFITREPADSSSVSITLNQSTLTESNLNLFGSGRSGETGYTVFAGSTRQSPVDVDGDGYTDVPKLFQWQIHPQLFLHAGENGKLRLGWNTSYEQRTGGSLAAVQDGPGTAVLYREFNRSVRHGGDLKFSTDFNGGKQLALKAAVSNASRRFESGNGFFSGNQWNVFSEASLLSPISAASELVTGINYLYNSYANDPAAGVLTPDYSRSTAGLFGQFSAGTAGGTNYELGLRADWNQSYGWFVLPSAAVIVHITPALSVRGNGGSGYKIPDPLDESLDAISPLGIPAFSSTLSAERSVGGTLEWNLKETFGDATAFINQTVFYTRVSDPVEISYYTPFPLFSSIASARSKSINGLKEPRFYPGGPVPYLRNAKGAVTSTGIDNYVRIDMAPYEFYIGYTYTVPKNDFTPWQPYQAYTPLHRAALTAMDDINAHWRAGVEASYNGYQYRDNGTKTPDVFFLAAMVQYAFPPFTVVLNGENLLDARQTKSEPVVLSPGSSPVFVPLWGPVDGRVINCSLLVKI